MAVHNYRAGIGSVGSYQVSGIPWLTGSTGLAGGGEDKIVFPSVAKAVTVINTDPSGDDDLRVHFNTSSAGAVQFGHHYVTLKDSKDSITFTMKCKEIYISNPGTGNSAYEVIAELTGIGKIEMFELTGSGLTD